MVDQTRFFITERGNISTNIANGTINANDFIICSDTHELVYVDNDLNYFAITSTDEGMNELIARTEARITELQETAENSVVTGVKGSAEVSYRRGNVNIGTGDIGLNNLTNHTQVRGLPTGTTENHIVTWGINGYVVKDSGINVVNGGIVLDKIILNSSTLNSNKQFEVTVNDEGVLQATLIE